MTHDESKVGEAADDAPFEKLDEGEANLLASLLRSALDDVPTPEKSLLPSIQQRIRQKTKGRFYRDRFSRARDPVPLLLMAALLILILAASLFLVMQPLVEPPQEIELETPGTDLFLAPDAEKEPK